MNYSEVTILNILKGFIEIFYEMVLGAGLEPARFIQAKDFKSFVSTDSTIRA